MKLKLKTFSSNKISELPWPGYSPCDTDQRSLCCRPARASYGAEVCHCDPVAHSFGCILESPGKLVETDMDAWPHPWGSLGELILQPELRTLDVIQSPFQRLNPQYSISAKSLYS